jgi:glycosyltransferase involved in cell wall biosynthesis
MQIKISVVVPTYKRPELLRSCLKCVLNQKLEKQQYEVIIVSDGPDFESKKVVTELSKETSANVRFLSLTTKKGPAAARNLGWQNASGTLIAFTDDDLTNTGFRKYFYDIKTNLKLLIQEKLSFLFLINPPILN